MTKRNYFSLILGTITCFIVGAMYYTIFGSELTKYSTAIAEHQDKTVSAVVELLRCLILSVVLLKLVNGLDTKDWRKALKLGLLLWIGFPLVLWLGAIIHENTPVILAIIHAGDWLIKLVVITTLFSYRNK